MYQAGESKSIKKRWTESKPEAVPNVKQVLLDCDCWYEGSVKVELIIKNYSGVSDGGWNIGR